MRALLKLRAKEKATILPSIEPELKVRPSAIRQEKGSKKKQNCHYLLLRYLSTQMIQGNLQININITAL